MSSSSPQTSADQAGWPGTYDDFAVGDYAEAVSLTREQEVHYKLPNGSVVQVKVVGDKALFPNFGPAAVCVTTPGGLTVSLPAWRLRKLSAIEVLARQT